MKLKSLVTFLYLIVSLPLFLFFRAEIVIWISFFINFLLITGIAYYHLNYEKSYSPFLTSYIVFTFLFFLVAPIIQISSAEITELVFPTRYPYRVSDVLYANFLILLFNVFFFIGYLFFKKKYKPNKKDIKVNENTFSTPLIILILFVCCALILWFNFGYIVDEINKSVYIAATESVSSILIRKKVLFLIPLGAIIITYRYLKAKKIITTNTVIAIFIFAFLLFLLLFLKNPLTEKRNALGPIYITLIYLFYPKLINSNAKFFLFLFVAMILVFPLMSALTHVDASFKEMVANPEVITSWFFKHGGITETFSTLNYDAFANIMATVEYVSSFGYSLGYQLLSALLFFIPRSIWASKSLSTGEVVGNYLMDEHNFSFNNLSNPLVSEGYINFGIFGIFVMSILLAYFIVKFIVWLNSTDALKEVMAFYFAVHLMFLLRGDFANGFSYFVGTFVGVLVIPKLIHKTIKMLPKKA